MSDEKESGVATSDAVGACSLCSGTGTIDADTLSVHCPRCRPCNQNVAAAAREELSFIYSYLANVDQDADHAWMARRIRAVLDGKDPGTVSAKGARTNEAKAFPNGSPTWQAAHAYAKRELVSILEEDTPYEVFAHGADWHARQTTLSPEAQEALLAIATPAAPVETYITSATDTRANKPLPVVISCPICRQQHIDQGEWATRPHRVHRCVAGPFGEGCGHEWYVAAVPTVGVRAEQLGISTPDPGSCSDSPSAGATFAAAKAVWDSAMVLVNDPSMHLVPTKLLRDLDGAFGLGLSGSKPEGSQ